MGKVIGDFRPTRKAPRSRDGSPDDPNGTQASRSETQGPADARPPVVVSSCRPPVVSQLRRYSGPAPSWRATPVTAPRRLPLHRTEEQVANAFTPYLDRFGSFLG